MFPSKDQVLNISNPLCIYLESSKKSIIYWLRKYRWIVWNPLISVWILTVQPIPGSLNNWLYLHKTIKIVVNGYFLWNSYHPSLIMVSYIMAFNMMFQTIQSNPWLALTIFLTGKCSCIISLRGWNHKLIISLNNQSKRQWNRFMI